VYVPRLGIGNRVNIILVAALAFALILAAPTPMTTKVYSDDVSADPVGNSPPPATDDQKQQKPAHDNNPPSNDKNKQPPSDAGVCVVGVESTCNAKEFQDPKLLGSGPKPKPFDCNGGLIDDKGNCIIEGKPPFDCNGGLIDDKGNCISNLPDPDDDCIFHPELAKCKSDNGKCPSGFANNENDHCYKLGPCPPGFAREDNDESGACKKLEIKCPSGF
jgi:hypothetical protein